MKKSLGLLFIGISIVCFCLIAVSIDDTESSLLDVVLLKNTTPRQKAFMLGTL